MYVCFFLYYILTWVRDGAVWGGGHGECGSDVILT